MIGVCRLLHGIVLGARFFFVFFFPPRVVLFVVVFNSRTGAVLKKKKKKKWGCTGLRKGLFTSVFVLFCQHWEGIGETVQCWLHRPVSTQAKELIYYNSYQCTLNGYNSLVTTQSVAFVGSIGEFWQIKDCRPQDWLCNNGALCKPCFKLEEFALKRSGEFGQPHFEVGDSEGWHCKLWESYFKWWGRTAQDWL